MAVKIIYIGAITIGAAAIADGQESNDGTVPIDSQYVHAIPANLLIVWPGFTSGTHDGLIAAMKGDTDQQWQVLTPYAGMNTSEIDVWSGPTHVKNTRNKAILVNFDFTKANKIEVRTMNRSGGALTPNSKIYLCQVIQ